MGKRRLQARLQSPSFYSSRFPVTGICAAELALKRQMYQILIVSTIFCFLSAPAEIRTVAHTTKKEIRMVAAIAIHGI